MPQGDAADQEARASDRKVFIGGVPFGIDQQQIREDFMQFGDIEDVYLPSDRNTGKLRGFAFVTYREPGTAKGAAQAMHGRDYHGRTITVNLARPRDTLPYGATSSFATSSDGPEGPRRRPQDYDRALEDRRRDEERARSRMLTDQALGRHRDRSRSPNRYGPDDPTAALANPYSHGNSHDGTGRYGERDPRPRQDYYD